MRGATGGFCCRAQGLLVDPAAAVFADQKASPVDPAALMVPLMLRPPRVPSSVRDTRGQLGINLLQRYLQEPESRLRFDLHWRSCFGCPKESRPPIRARTSSLKYPVLSWKKSVAARHTQKKTPWSLTSASCLQAMPSVGWQKKERTMQGSQFLTWSGSCPTGGDSKGLPDTQHGSG